MFYSIEAAKNYDEIFAGAFEDISEACRYSRFQLISPETVSIKINGNIPMTDYICVAEAVPVFSAYAADAVLSLRDTDNLFRKDVNVISGGESLLYKILVPSAIDAADRLNSVFRKDVNRVYAEKLVISAALAGRYHMFRLRGVNDGRIFVTERMKAVIEEYGLNGIMFKKL